MYINKVAETLLRAADYIDLHGWVRGISKDKRGRCCLIGALDEAGPAECQHVAVLLLVNVTGAEAGIANWNDRKCKSKEHAIKVLHEAASLAQSNSEALKGT